MIPTRSNLEIDKSEQVISYFNSSVMIDSDQKEFIATGKHEENVVQNQEMAITTFNDVVFKADFIRTFEALIPRLDLSGTEKILEMGAAHGWASALLKSKYPDCYVVASDLVPDAIKHAAIYEKLLNINLDEKWSFNCRDIPFEAETFDRIFAFAAFHHFGEYGDYSNCLEQMVNILKPKGKIVLLYEPSSPQYLYKYAFKRVNKRLEIDGVDEDVLVPSKIKKIAEKLGCKFEYELFPFYNHRPSIASTNYYYLLSKLGWFQRFFVSTVNIVIEKP